MPGWLWWILCGLGGALLSYGFFPMRKAIGLGSGTIVAVVGAVLGGYLFNVLAKYPATHWITLLAASVLGLLFLWLVRLFSPRRIL
jgi:uncharacterized membrane protein YeaQ/YmgE (transglycosylase-associated protein family)